MEKNLPTIRTKRLILRPWKEEDLTLFAAMNQDPRVMEYFPSTRSLEDSRRSLHDCVNHFKEYGFGVWAAELLDSGEFIGFIGLQHVNFTTSFTPAIEILWRLRFEYWGRGLATEGAKAVLAYGFDTLNLAEIVSFTTVQNMRSRHVMEKIGMHHNVKDDFDHPKLETGHPLKRHVLYRISQQDWRKNLAL